MTILRVSQTRHNCCEVSLSDGRAFRFHLETAMGAGFRPGCELTEERLEELLHVSELCLAREYALKLLAARACSRKRLTERLAERFDRDVAEETAGLMAEAGLVDDAEYAFMLAADMLRLKRYGDSRVIRELRQKGISREDAVEALERAYEEFPEDIPDEEERIRELLRLRGVDLSDERQKRRAVDQLIRLGYDYGDIRRAAQIFEDEQY